MATKFTQEVIESILLSMSIGATQTDAARTARISDQTLSDWLAEGRKARMAQACGEKLDAKARSRLDFLERVEQAEAQCSVDMQTIVYNAAQSDPAIAQWWLERRRPEQFRLVTRNEASGPNGGPQEIVIRYADADIA